jgi:hypothetical protein
MSDSGTSIWGLLRTNPLVDISVLVAVVLNAYIVFRNARLRSFDVLLEPLGSPEARVIQLSGVLAVIYLAEFLKDRGDDGHSRVGHDDSGSGALEWVGKLAEALPLTNVFALVVVFWGYQRASSYAGFGASLTGSPVEPSVTNPVVGAMQMSLIAMVFIAGSGIGWLVDRGS